MSILQAIILGLIQGLTEFLPVSSSGHLAIMQSLFSDFEQPGMLYDTLLHLATLLAVFVYFRKRIYNLFLAFLGYFFAKYSIIYNEQKHWLWGIVVASIPTGVLGLLFRHRAEALFTNISVIGALLIVTSLLLMLSDKDTKSGDKNINLTQALIIGISQGIAVFPGLSRSGTTIFAAIRSGVNRQSAAEFSFLISVPAILGATVLQLEHISSIPTGMYTAYILGMLTAFISGLFAIGVMIKLVQNARLRYFALYCLFAGIATIIFL